MELHPEQHLEISDDTQLTLATCEAIAEARRVDPERIAARFLAWFRAGRITGIGSSTLKAMRDLDAGAHWALSGAEGEFAAGNGAAMRVAPLAFLLDPTAEGDRVQIRDVARITHRNEEAYVGALAVVAAVRLVATGRWSPRQQLTREVAELLPDSLVRDKLLSFANRSPDATATALGAQFGNSGYVADSVPLAIHAAQRVAQDGLYATITGAIEAGGDTDTIASMAGQIAGAWIGASRVPDELIDELPESELVLEVATRFAGVVQRAV